MHIFQDVDKFVYSTEIF